MRRTNDHHAPRCASLAGLFLACLLPLSARAASGDDDIVVTGFEGDVHITSAGAPLAPRPGAVIGLPGAVRTGADGSVDLRQGETTIGVGPATQLEFPAPSPAGPIDRVSQPAGNAYYSVAPRGPRKLRVETPFLVAVIKGTQFNVSVTAEASTITLDEGLLEILATDGAAEPVMLNAGEVAVRRRNETAIRVLKVGTSGAAPAGSGGAGGVTTTLEPSDDGGGGPGLPGGATLVADDAGDVLVGAQPGASTLPGDVGILTGAEAGIDADAANVGATLDAGIDLGSGTIDAGVDAGADLGAGTVDAGFDAGADAGVASADAGVDAGADLGGGTVDVGAEAGVDAVAGITAEAEAAAGVDATAGTIDASVDAGVAGVDTGVDAGVDLTGPDAGVDIGADVLGTEIDVGIGGDASQTDPATSQDSESSGGLLGGILGRPRT